MSSNNSTSAAVSTSSSDAASSSQVSIATTTSSGIPSSSQPPTSSVVPSSSAPSSSTPTATSFVATSTAVASSQPPSTTNIVTSVVTVSESNTSNGQPTVVVITTQIAPQSTQDPSTTATSASTGKSTSTEPATLQSGGGKSTTNHGLSPGGKTAVAVVVPVVVVALLVLAGIFLWRRRKQRKSAEEARRKEVEEYGFNPNNDPTLPAVGGIAGSEMAEDQSGYRGWGNTTNPSNRKASTTLSGGMTHLSDSGSNPGGYHSPGSPTAGNYSDGNSGDALMNNRHDVDPETIGALGAAPTANANRGDIRRGPSNASSSYSAANRSDTSGETPMPMSNPQDYYMDNAYYQPGPYGDGKYTQQPVIRDVQARRNTRIESPSVFPQQGAAGIAQNF